jgi:hypothetical protein
VHWVVAETSAALAPAIEPWAPGAVLGDISLYPQNTRRLLAAAEADGYWPPNERALATPEGLRVVLAVSEMALMSTIPLDDDPNDLNIQEDPNHPGPLARRLAGRHPGTPVGDALAGEQRLEGARSSEGTLDPVVYTQAIADLTTNPGPALYVLLDRYVLLPNDALAAIDAVIARGGPYAEPALRLRARDAALRGDRAGLARWIAMFDALTPAAFPDDATRLLAARDWDEARVVARGPSESESWQEAVQQATRACIPVQEWVAETELSARWDGAAWTLTRADGLPVACSFQPARAPTGPTVATVRLW